jgi:hypothetical protein
MAKRETRAAKPARIRATGGCLCGAVKYEVKGELRPVWNCHCGQCRKFHGHFGAYTNTKNKDITIVGRTNLKWYVSSKVARRGFCGKCGSSLFWQRFKGDGISIAATEHSGDYYKIADRLDRFPGTMSGAAAN